MNATVSTDAVRVADTFVTLMQAFQRAKAKFRAAAEHDVEWSAHMVLRAIAAEGPMRSGALAECLQSDPSTVSRQVASMVKEGLLERTADAVDGRASILVPTERARMVLAELEAIRHEQFARMLSGWSDSDLQRFSQLLGRFAHDYETASQDWITERLATRAGSTEGNLR